MTRILSKPIEDPPEGVYSVIKEYAIADVDWDWSNHLQLEHASEWNQFHKIYPYDGSVRLWLHLYYNELYDWLETCDIDWIGLQSSRYNQLDIFVTISIRIHRPQDITQFKLRWC